MRRGWIIRAYCKFLMESERTDVRTILIPGAVGFKAFICNCKRIFAGLGARFMHGKSIVAAEGTRAKPNVLYDRALTHLAPIGKGRTDNYQSALDGSQRRSEYSIKVAHSSVTILEGKNEPDTHLKHMQRLGVHAENRIASGI